MTLEPIKLLWHHLVLMQMWFSIQNQRDSESLQQAFIMNLKQ